MYTLNDFCCICFRNKKHLRPLSDSDSGNITYLIKLTSCVPEMCFNEINDQWVVCNKCCETMNSAYKFRQRCLGSKTTLIEYISQFRKADSGEVNVSLIDLNKFCVMKQKYQKEIDINKTETILNVNEVNIEKENSENNPVIKIKTENTPSSSKLVDSEQNYIQFENVVIKVEREDAYVEEQIEEDFDNPLVNKDEADLNQNDNEEHLYEKFDSVMETGDSENDDMESKDEKFNYLHSETSEPSTNLDAINYDITENIIEDEDKTNKEAKLFLKSLEEKPNTSLTNTPTLENYGIITQNEQIQQKHECTLCNKQFTQSSALYRHSRNHSGVKAFECSVCHKKFNESTNLKTHMRIHTGERPYECEVCQKAFSNMSTLKDHVKIHSGIKAYSCEVCQKRFAKSCYLKKHMIIHTVEQTYQCTVCEKTFTQAAYLTGHMRTHTGKKKHECNLCQKTFTESSSLREHIKIHTGQRPFPCNVCGKRFNQPSQVVGHLRVHTGERPFACTLCDKKFTKSSNLKGHMRTHTGEKPHECKICKRKFSHSSHLIGHMRTHTGERPYECTVCLKKFSQSSNLMSHMKTHTTETQ